MTRTFLSALLGMLASTGCSSTQPSTGPSTTQRDGGSCFVLATDYDQSCSEDADCVFVPPGGNVCDPCSTDSACLVCQLSAMNKDASAAYEANLSGGLALFPTDGKTIECVTDSCPRPSPDGGGPACVSGRCTSTFAGFVANSCLGPDAGGP